VSRDFAYNFSKLVIVYSPHFLIIDDVLTGDK